MKILIADDEFHIRRGIQASIPWASFDIEEVVEAEDGTKAMALFDHYAPDIVLLDINMPGANGLEVARHIRQSSLTTQIVFLTGYDDFPKVKEAVTLHASDYLLKPVSYDDLLQALEKAAQQVGENRRQSGYVEELHRKLNRYERAVADQMLVEFLQRRMPQEECGPLLTELGFANGTGIAYGLLCIDIDDFEQSVAQMSGQDRHTRLLAYRTTVQAAVDEEQRASGGTNRRLQGYVLNLSEARLLVWLSFAAADDLPDTEAALLHIAGRLQQSLRDRLNLSVTVGLSGCDQSLEAVPELYKEAVRAAEFRAVLGHGAIVPARLLETPGTGGQKLIAKELVVLSELRTASGTISQAVLEEWLRELAHLPLPEAKIIASQLMLFAYRLYAENTVETSEMRSTFADIARCETAEQLAGCLRQLIAGLSEQLQGAKEKPAMPVIEQARGWIREHVSEELSLNALASSLHLSPFYLSRLFKQETGETYQEFTTRVRFERARELLSGTALKMHEIAEQVGFKDANYFSIAFKKHEGISPTDFRKRFQA